MVERGDQEAANKELVDSLREEKESNPGLLVIGYFKWNDLHLAAIKGETKVFRILSERQGEHQRSPLHFLSETLDSHQRSPLHLASAHGHSEIVKLLVEANSKVCLARDRDGLNPLHAAAVAGELDVLEALLKANPCAARVTVDRGRERDTILHLCVKYDQLEFLKRLLEHFKGEEFVNTKDHSGNTILHLAVANKRFKIIKYVLGETKINVNAKNASNQTAMDILIRGRGESTKPEDWELGIDDQERTEPEEHGIEELFRAKKGKREKDLTHYEWIENKRKSLTIVAILLATIAFQAGVNPPGGVWLDNLNGHQAGEAVMAYNHPHSYPYFICCNTIGFVASLITITCLISGVFKNRYYLVMLVVVMCISITSMAFTYAYAIVVFTPKWKREAVNHTIVVAVIVWFGVQVIILLFHGNRWIRDIAENRAKAVRWIRRSGHGISHREEPKSQTPSLAGATEEAV
ncbi:hypothetical protein Vadar_008007 [Vaccinium darrowii]|uniref:Uncharacterized protein n=1 Tax=Vaccinium darrowii TaxID=229202 RepID=A0ACB7X8V1_9ERIC|nr:hypothetical protein Vadar_008007 [Vaccinium darrowii]